MLDYLAFACPPYDKGAEVNIKVIAGEKCVSQNHLMVGDFVMREHCTEVRIRNYMH